jgi:hypothetical protein
MSQFAKDSAQKTHVDVLENISKQSTLPLPFRSPSKDLIFLRESKISFSAN